MRVVNSRIADLYGLPSYPPRFNQHLSDARGNTGSCICKCPAQECSIHIRYLSDKLRWVQRQVHQALILDLKTDFLEVKPAESRWKREGTIVRIRCTCELSNSEYHTTNYNWQRSTQNEKSPPHCRRKQKPNRN